MVFALLHQSIHFTSANQYDFLVPFQYATNERFIWISLFLLHQSIHFTGANEYDFLVPFHYATKTILKDLSEFP